jgi:predicted anti-sigma-YlaC factor YlaD
MGFHLRRTTPCERAVRSISLRLDDELSELEEAALDRHLARCAGCRTIAEETIAFTQLLREAPLVEVGRRFAVTAPRRSRARLARRTAAAFAFAGAVAAASLVAVLGVFIESEPSHASSALGFRDMAEQHQFVRSELRRLEPYPQYIVESAPPKFLGRGLI